MDEGRSVLLETCTIKRAASCGGEEANGLRFLALRLEIKPLLGSCRRACAYGVSVLKFLRRFGSLLYVIGGRSLTLPSLVKRLRRLLAPLHLIHRLDPALNLLHGCAVSTRAEVT